MTKIIITIEVEGGNVTVTNGASRAQRPARTSSTSNGGSKPFVERPDPEYPDWDPVCPVHGLDWKLIKAGVSKTKVDENGNPKRFNAFWTCPERDCPEKPEREPDGTEDLGF